METIKSYLAIIDPQLINQLSGKPAEFVRLLQQNKPETEEIFIQEICGKNKDKSYYQVLKSRTKKILQILAIFSTLKGASEAKKKLDNCHKNFVAGQKFLTAGKRTEGLRLIKKAWRLAVDYDFVHLACELASILYHDQAYYQKNEAKANYYAAQVEYHLSNYLAEKKIEHHFYQMILQKSRSAQLLALEKTLGQIDEYPGKSIKYKVYVATLQVTYHFHKISYESVIHTCNKTLVFFESKKGVYSSYQQLFFSKRGLAQMAIRKYDDATESFQKASVHVPKKSFNDYLLRLYQTLNALHSKQYKVAYQMFQQSKRCSFTPIVQQFIIIEAYLCFLSHQGYLQLDRKFRLGKFLNEIIKAQADKEEGNINVLIVELLVYLTRNCRKFIDRIDAISNYSYRHLQGEETKRAKRFIKILCLMPRANFNPIALKRIASRQIKYIEDHPLHLGDNFAIEVIPFEDLLAMIMQDLERKAA